MQNIDLLMGETRNLSVKPEPCLTFLLSDLQLPLLVFADIGYANFVTKSSKGVVFGCINSHRQSLYLPF